MRKNWIDNLRWLTVLLFLLAGISARYSLEKSAVMRRSSSARMTSTCAFSAEQ